MDKPINTAWIRNLNIGWLVITPLVYFASPLFYAALVFFFIGLPPVFATLFPVVLASSYAVIPMLIVCPIISFVFLKGFVKTKNNEKWAKAFTLLPLFNPAILFVVFIVAALTFAS